MKLFFSLLLAVCGLLGILDAGYLTYGELSGQLPPCKPPFACRTVLDSPWSKVGPIPLAAFGILFYSTMLLLGSLSFLNVEKLSLGGIQLPVYKIIAGFGVFGLLFSLWLVFIMGVVLHAWCLYCLLSALNCVIIFILSSSLFRIGYKENYALHI